MGVAKWALRSRRRGVGVTERESQSGSQSGSHRVSVTECTSGSHGVGVIEWDLPNGIHRVGFAEWGLQNVILRVAQHMPPTT